MLHYDFYFSHFHADGAKIHSAGLPLKKKIDQQEIAAPVDMCDIN